MQLKHFCSVIPVLNRKYCVTLLPIHLTNISFPQGKQKELGEEFNYTGKTEAALETRYFFYC